MNKVEYDQRLRNIIYTCGVNVRYHQIVSSRWSYVDRGIRILVGILAIGGAILAVPKLDCPWLGFWIAVLSALAAAILNILPVGDWEKKHLQLSQGWSDILKTANAEEFKTCCLEDQPDAHRFERLHELLAEMESLNAMEPTPWDRLLNRCQEEENEREWGKGIRTFEQVEQERARRLAQSQATSLPLADVRASEADRG